MQAPRSPSDPSTSWVSSLTEPVSPSILPHAMCYVISLIDAYADSEQFKASKIGHPSPSPLPRHRFLPLTIHTPLHAFTDSVSPPAIQDQARLQH